ncbi:hypothetical protein EBZ80_19555 [bacterium]|nr:hypothetical protein [bacterium]
MPCCRLKIVNNAKDGSHDTGGDRQALHVKIFAKRVWKPNMAIDKNVVADEHASIVQPAR